jgi:hypothetical protein
MAKKKRREQSWPWPAHLRFLCSAAMPGGLAPEHRADLEASGLDAAMIEEQRLRSVPPRMLTRPPGKTRWSDTLIGFDVPDVQSALLFPFFDLADKNLGLMDFVRVKVFPPRCDSQGHAVKYLQRKGTPPRLYAVRRVADVVRDSTVPLWLLEGEKKAMAAAQAGHAAVGFLGVEAWHTKGSAALLADFDAIPLAGRVVELVPDGDVQTNPDVERGVRRFAAALERRGARVRIVLLPTEGAP